MTASSCEFSFRIWVHPELGDPPDIEVWYDGFEPTESRRGFFSEWAHAALCELQSEFWDEFGLDKSKHWQVIGRATLQGRFNYEGEYDEDLDVIEFDKVEGPDSFWESGGITDMTLRDYIAVSRIEPRVKRLSIDPDCLLDLLKIKGGRVVIDGEAITFACGPIPDDATVIKAGIGDHGEIHLIIADESFHPVPSGALIPRIIPIYQVRKLPSPDNTVGDGNELETETRGNEDETTAIREPGNPTSIIDHTA